MEISLFVNNKKLSPKNVDKIEDSFHSTFIYSGALMMCYPLNIILIELE